ncbi:molecular chaperone DnaJ [Planomonospora corallina]|uniref:Molecular chaperone DnaJ n=1 Tax=Planomonospora corallina TaxID=1806052 RepID=A0ABV8IF73_9ACTN
MTAPRPPDPAPARRGGDPAATARPPGPAPERARGHPAATTAEAIALVCAARTPRDLFGGDAPRRTYRRLARLLHPDLTAAPGAPEAFARLAALWDAALRDGTGGTGAPGETGETRETGRTGETGETGEDRTGPEETVVTTRRGTHRIGRTLHRGATAVLRACEGDLLVKVPLRPADNDLLRREAEALRTLEREADPRLLPYVPRLADSFRHRAGGVERQVNVVSRVPDGFLTLDEVRRRRPVLDPRDTAWIWRRLLVAVGTAHRAGIVHGAVFGHHVLVHPIEHGLVLVDWSQSVPTGAPLTALVARCREDYPPDVLARRPATEILDIRLATRCVAALMGVRPDQTGPDCRNVPARMRAFLRGSLLAPPRDAWRLLAELDELLEDLYGPRRYRPLRL